jgi:hypothetical protein
MKKIISAFTKRKKGVEGTVTMEWVAITAVIILAAIVITAAIMHSASNLGAAVITNIDTATTNIQP